MGLRLFSHVSLCRYTIAYADVSGIFAQGLDGYRWQYRCALERRRRGVGFDAIEGGAYRGRCGFALFLCGRSNLEQSLSTEIVRKSE